MKDTIKNLVVLRDLADTDHSFIYATWLRGLYYGNSFFKQIDKDQFMERYQLIVQNLLFKPTVLIRVACLKEDADTILGYAVMEQMVDDLILHWAFVKPEWRKQGIAQDLIPESVTTITHIVDSICSLKLKDKSKSDKWLSNYEMKLKNKRFKFKPFFV